MDQSMVMKVEGTRGTSGTVRANAWDGDTSWEDGIETLMKRLDGWTRSSHGE